MQKPLPLSADALSEREHIADAEFENYRFGDGVTVVAHDGWNRDDQNDFTKIAYVEYDDDPADADSHKVSFHVCFNDDGSIDDVYALEMRHGGDIGVRGDAGSANDTSGGVNRLAEAVSL